jgi:F-type H+-transporting ATPase subunit b
MLELNKWFFFQLANFLLLLIFLNFFLFKPFLRLFKERQDRTQGALEEAKALDGEKDTLLAEIESKLTEARGRARTAFEDLSNEGLKKQKQELDEAQKEALEINRKAREDLEVTVNSVRSSLKSDIEGFSRKIVEKLVGA